MPTNVYVAPGMLGKKIRHWSNVADPEWAESYLEANFGLWTKEAREILQRLYDDPVVAREREGYLAGFEDRLVEGRKLPKEAGEGAREKVRVAGVERQEGRPAGPRFGSLVQAVLEGGAYGWG